MKKEHISEVQQAVQNIMQGCLSLSRVLSTLELTKTQSTEDQSRPETPGTLHDAHVRAWREHGGEQS